MRARRTFSALLACLALFGCSAEEAAEDCLPGARICDGNVVLVCDPEERAFRSERTCPLRAECVSGKCSPVGFSDIGIEGTDDLGDRPDLSSTGGGDGRGDPGNVYDQGRGTRDPGGARDPGTPEDPGWHYLDPGQQPDPGFVLVDPGPEPDPGRDTGSEPGDTSPSDTHDPGTSTTDPGGTASDDARPTDAGGEDATGEDTGSGAVHPFGCDEPAPRHVLAPGEAPYRPENHRPVYEKVTNILVIGDLIRVRWHPCGDFALVLGAGSDTPVLRYDAETFSIEQIAVLDGSALDLDADPGGRFFLMAGVGGDDTGALWRATVSEGGQIAVEKEASIPFGRDGVAVEAEEDGSTWVIGSRSEVGASSQNGLHLWTEDEGFTKSKVWGGPGLSDVMWASPAVYSGSRALVTSEGSLGAQSRSWVLQTDLLVSNNYRQSFGNPGGAAWRPGGGYGFLTGWTSNKIYVFDGQWTSKSLPGVGTAASPQAIGFHPSGRRALIVGSVIGTPLKAVVIEHRPLDAVGHDSNAYLDASITGFEHTPWFGRSSTHLLSIDWRPRSRCDEGLVSGADNGSAFSPTFGTLARFYDPDDPTCSAMP